MERKRYTIELNNHSFTVKEGEKVATIVWDTYMDLTFMVTVSDIDFEMFDYKYEVKGWDMSDSKPNRLTLNFVENKPESLREYVNNVVRYAVHHY